MPCDRASSACALATPDEARNHATTTRRCSSTGKVISRAETIALIASLGRRLERRAFNRKASPACLRKFHYFEQIRSPHLKWAFTIDHAHYDPAGIKGFIDDMDMSRCEEVRVADNNGLFELHMHPGTGTVDFVDMFRRIEAAGFTGHYMCGWGTPDQMLAGRDYLVARAGEAGIAVG